MISKDATRALAQTAPHKSQIFLPIALIVLLLIVIDGINIVGATRRLAEDAQDLQTFAQGGTEPVLQTGSFDPLDLPLARTAEDIHTLRAAVGPLVFLTPLFGWLPRYGGDLANAGALLEFGDAVTSSGRNTLTIAQAASSASKPSGSSNSSMGAAILQVAQRQTPAIHQARQDLAGAAQARTRIDAERLSPALRTLVYRFDQWLPMWQGGLNLLAKAPTILGDNAPRVYLLLALNSDELRATGGFITGVTLLRVDKGEITLSNFQDSYSVDDLTKAHPDPPPALDKYMDAGTWVLRDSNWSPDFPTAARVAENIYQIDQGIAVDGVIAVNLEMLTTPPSERPDPS